MISRRNLLAGAASVAAVPALTTLGLAEPKGRFRVVHLTDLHIQPELGAADGVSLCVQKVLALHPRPDFILTGGDHVMDLLQVSHDRADLQFKLFAERTKPLEMPVRHCVGNHDVFGWTSTSPITASDPSYGKAMFQERLTEGKTYYSFDHKGWHFIVLDTIGVRGKEWFSHVDDAQLEWLKSDLAAVPVGQPVLVNLHVPILTAFLQEWTSTMAKPDDRIMTTNGKAVFDLLRTRSVKLVLQGHTHILESIDYLGTKFYTAGAVSGEWWKGPRLGVHPEGFTVLDFNGSEVSVKYVPYGWKARTS